MPVQCEDRVLAAHAAAVVAHLDEGLAAVLQLDAHVVGAGVERVLDQLLDHGAGTLDHFARGDLVGDGIGENGYTPRHGPGIYPPTLATAASSTQPCCAPGV